METKENKNAPEGRPSEGSVDRADETVGPEVMALEVPEPVGERLSTVDAITTGNVRKAVWNLAWPTLVANVLMTLTGVLNAFFVGQLGSRDAMAAVGWAEQILMVIFSVVMSVAVGTTALVARFVGARNLKDAEEAARQSLLLAVVAANVGLAINGRGSCAAVEGYGGGRGRAEAKRPIHLDHDSGDGAVLRADRDRGGVPRTW
ncbi:MAG: MATE family efflux transporter [Armatimonadota bacterium]